MTSVNDVIAAMERALADRERGYGRYAVVCEDGALRYIAQIANGDVRVALSALELAFLTTPETTDG